MCENLMSVYETLSELHLHECVNLQSVSELQILIS